MKKTNLTPLALLFLLAFSVITAVLYQHQKAATIHEAETRMDIFMKKWQALFDYVEINQKNSIYKLQKKGVLDHDFFDPHILSFTYIAREIQLIYEKLEKQQGETPYYYRLAATNPRNPANLASKAEEVILQKFRDNQLVKYSEIVNKGEKRFYVTYKPIDRTTESCMRCHSVPDRAPKDLVKRYGSVVGFGDKVGGIRAMIVLEIPISEIEKDTMANFLLTSIVLFGVFLGSFIFISILMKKERKLAVIIETNNELIAELKESLEQVKLLEGFLPICASCKQIRDDKGYWKQIEHYISEHSEVQFSHSICPDCAKKLYPEFADKDGKF